MKERSGTMRRDARPTLREWMVIAALGAAFAPALLALSRAWSAADYQSHGYLVPAVAAWIAWGTRHRRRRLPSEGDARGGVLLAASLVLYAASLAASSVSGQGLALVGAIAGAVWFLRGARWLRALAFPVLFLVFMVPIPPDWLGPIVVRLMLFVSSSSVALLQGLGVAVAREGNVLQLAGGQSLFVAEACSGLTSIVTLIPIAVLIAYLSPLTGPARTLLVALTLPVALAANLLRVVLTVLAATVWGAQAVTAEPWHGLFGLSVYATATIGLLALAAGLGRWPRLRRDPPLRSPRALADARP